MLSLSGRGQEVKARHLSTYIIFTTVAAAIYEAQGRKRTEKLFEI
jgi:hypothetical protein